MIDYNKIVWVCPKCGAASSFPAGSNPHNDCHCIRCSGTLIETKYTYGDWMGMPGYNDVSKEQVFQEYVYNNEQYDPELIAQWRSIIASGTSNSSVTKPNQNNVPKCPTCGSTNIRKISTLNRAVSIGTLGLLSGKIGKNYECLNCKAKW